MKRMKFTESLLGAALKQYEDCVVVEEISRRLAVSGFCWTGKPVQLYADQGTVFPGVGK